VETVFERRGTAVDDENLFGSLALQLQAVWIITAAKRGRLERIAHNRLHPFGDGSRDMLHPPRLGYQDGLEQRDWNQQHFAARRGHEIRDYYVAGHQRQLVKGIAGY